MSDRLRDRAILITAFWLCGALLIPHASAQGVLTGPVPHVVHFDPTSMESRDLFTGAPQTVSLESGYVALAPSDSVGTHSTKSFEEILLVIKGRGEMRIAGGTTLLLLQNCLAYCPPFTAHNVVNTGSDTLRYIWLAARGVR